MHIGKIAAVGLLMTVAVACMPPEKESKYDVIATGKVVKAGRNSLLLENKGSFMFVGLDPADKAVRERIKKGDEITLLGKNPGKDAAKGATPEIDEIVLPDGSHITFGQ